ncbi:SMI1/KNR4 family protein [Pseudoalteromonas sp. SR45-5]|uniref:SMI1/KNR4 family protein n=1 Tax=Pseudoalteromonas sp. SR45-5 TaxID=2760928 RepID=UPI0015FD0EF4|nr:SMI1/KNR4 family protein [Pseudoalteromonas sp. SR45-5]MBB1355795.1 hypothetical protein [Pseudoalteromonas sp. SR45-5]
MTLSKNLDEKIKNFDFDYIESYLGKPVPSCLKELYESGEVFELENIIVDEEEDDDEGNDLLYICIANWEPLNEERYQRPWPGTEKYLNFAQDGSGNLFIAKPEENFEVVHFFDHETGELESLNINIPTFIDKVREWNED